MTANLPPLHAWNAGYTATYGAPVHSGYDVNACSYLTEVAAHTSNSLVTSSEWLHGARPICSDPTPTGYEVPAYARGTGTAMQ